MRTLAVIPRMGSGGAESVVAQLALAWFARGQRVAVTSSGGWRAAELAARGVGVVEVPTLLERGAVAQARSAVGVGRELRRNPVDVVHAHNPRSALVARAALRYAGSSAPVVCTVHGLAARQYSAAVRVLRHAADAVVAVSPDVADRLAAAGRPGVRVVANAAAADGLVDRATARARLDLATTERVTVCLARVEPPKRHDLLLRAWEADPGLGTLLVAGDGPERAALEAWTLRHGLGGRVRWLGDRRDAGCLLSAADVVVLPSDREGLPVVVLESMAAGVPVVASDVGGLRELAEGVRLVPPGSRGAVGRAVGDLLADPEARRRQVEAARGLVERRFSAAAMLQGYGEVFAETLARPRRTLAHLP